MRIIGECDTYKLQSSLAKHQESDTDTCKAAATLLGKFVNSLETYKLIIVWAWDFHVGGLKFETPCQRKQGVCFWVELVAPGLPNAGYFSYVVGIYGYTAYSASKFGLKGLAEALQQEVIGENIHVSLIFPPDTETPGFAEENKRRPQLTSILAASSGSMKADEVAKKALNGLKSGNFIVPCNFEGFFLSIATAGLSPQRSFLMAFIEVIAAGILRVVGLCFQWNWYGSIDKFLEERK
ncbi:hypothetical protein MTR67_027643 [Solanum verrucosum]|uniref:3-ketodihydrosphingosine reductase n=1 Tax=Solanum verrucosum TaxID=315347 RepID=A0AAF0R420_SOLVR|nr:hypothetical protein MTR67_027643 [Solanum verrucosum]